MAEENNEAQGHQQPVEPAPDLGALDRLVGTWELSGDVTGTVSYEWMEGGFFLLQRVDLGSEASGLGGHRQRERYGAEARRGHQRAASTRTRETRWTTSTSWRETPSRSGSGRRGRPRTTGASSVETVSTELAPVVRGRPLLPEPFF